MKHALVAVIGVALCLTPLTARADAPPRLPDKVAEVKTFVLSLTEPVNGMAIPTPDQKAAIAAKMNAPFWYDGLTFSGMDDQGEKLAKACKKTWKKTGTIRAAGKLPDFVGCLAVAQFSGALDGDAEWSLVDLKKLPRPFKKHKAKLTKLAKDHVLVISHFIPAGPAEYYDLWVVKRAADGTLHLAGLLAVNLDTL